MLDEITPLELIDATQQIGANSVIVLLYFSAIGANGECSPSITEICDACHLSRATVVKSLDLMLAAGIITRSRRQRQTSVYNYPEIVSKSNSLKVQNLDNLYYSNIYTEDNLSIVQSNSSTNELLDFEWWKRCDSEFISAAQAESIFRTVTTWASVPASQRDETTRMICDIWRVKRGETVEYLRPFFDEQRKRYPRSTKNFWLEWAAAGTIPQPKGSSNNGHRSAAEIEAEAERKKAEAKRIMAEIRKGK